MSFTLAQLLSAVRREDSVVSAETSGYVALALAEQALDGRSWDENSVCLEAAGTLTVHRNSEPAPRVSQRAVLNWLLSRAPGENLALAACCRASFKDDAAWVGALRSALVPLNRAAAKRALMRLHRRLAALGDGRLAEYVAAERAALERELLQPPSAPAELQPLSAPTEERPSPGRELLQRPIARTEERPSLCISNAPSDKNKASVELPPEILAALETQEHTPRVLLPEVRSRWDSESTPQLCSWAVELRVPLADSPLRRDVQGDETQALWPKGIEATESPSMEQEPSLASVAVTPEPVVSVAPLDEQTVPEPVSLWEREPGLGQVLGRKSDVSELLSSFGVGSALTERELLAALRRSIESQGTPLPARVAAAPRRR